MTIIWYRLCVCVCEKQMIVYIVPGTLAGSLMKLFRVAGMGTALSWPHAP